MNEFSMEGELDLNSKDLDLNFGPSFASCVNSGKLLNLLMSYL